METTKQDTKNMAVSNNNELIGDNNQPSSFLRRFGIKAAVYTGATALVGLYGVPVVFSWIGFSSIGVTAGSYAAWWQSIHFVPGMFGFMQSVTATGAAGAFVTKVGVGGALMKAYIDARANKSEKEENIKQEVRSKL